ISLKAGARLNSETAGAMIDRLSILSLKIRAMRKQTERTDVDEAHIETCRAKLLKLHEQRADLAACLDRLFEEFARGESYYKIYRQFKMYNDPKLNPAVYREQNRAGESRALSRMPCCPSRGGGSSAASAGAGVRGGCRAASSGWVPGTAAGGCTRPP